MAEEDPTIQVLQVAFADPPEPENDSYELALARSTGVLALR
jgi:hypothetical protein